MSLVTVNVCGRLELLKVGMVLCLALRCYSRPLDVNMCLLMVRSWRILLLLGSWTGVLLLGGRQIVRPVS